jgi:Domain of Unknown Function (DUF1521)
MTEINQFAGANINAQFANTRPMEGLAFVVAAGVMGQFFNQLGAGPFAFAQLPQAFNVAMGILAGGCYHPCPGPVVLPEPKAQWSTQMTGQNTANIDLGDGQKLQIDERSSEMYIINENTGEKTRIWGDPHVDVDGKHAFDFWGTTTFTLENGTKITINTEQWNGNPNAYVASQVVITKGENAIVVDGISQNQLGDLKVTMSNDGRAVDAAHGDGYVLHENANGAGWLSSHTGQIATQADMNATLPGQAYGPGTTHPDLSWNQVGDAMALFLFAGVLGNLFNFGSNDGGSVNRAQRRDDQWVPRPAIGNPNIQFA